MSADTSASVRGFIARKFSGCSRSLPTVSCLYGTEPITSVGLRRRISSSDPMCQQSPSFGRAPTGATSAHHLVTPTSVLFAPIAHKIAVALGASETIRWPCSASFFMLPQKHSRRVAALPTERGRGGRALTPLSECAGLRLQRGHASAMLLGEHEKRRRTR